MRIPSNKKILADRNFSFEVYGLENTIKKRTSAENAKILKTSMVTYAKKRDYVENYDYSDVKEFWEIDDDLVVELCGLGQSLILKVFICLLLDPSITKTELAHRLGLGRPSKNFGEIIELFKNKYKDCFSDEKIVVENGNIYISYSSLLFLLNNFRPKVINTYLLLCGQYDDELDYDYMRNYFSLSQIEGYEESDAGFDDIMKLLDMLKFAEVNLQEKTFKIIDKPEGAERRKRYET